MPPFQASALDKVLAGMESAAMAYIAYPASKALGKVLLQTAPEGGESNALNGLKRAVKIVSSCLVVKNVGRERGDGLAVWNSKLTRKHPF